jgi:hypothetical protein
MGGGGHWPLLVALSRHCERSEAIQALKLDCFVALLLAMTVR